MAAKTAAAALASAAFAALATLLYFADTINRAYTNVLSILGGTH